MPEMTCYDPTKFTTEEALALHTALKAVLTIFDTEWDPTKYRNLPLKDRQAISDKQIVQYRFLDTCFRPIYQLAGGALVQGPIEYLTPDRVPKIIQSALSDLVKSI
jgi:hypothetical protein